MCPECGHPLVYILLVPGMVIRWIFLAFTLYSLYLAAGVWGGGYPEYMASRSHFGNRSDVFYPGPASDVLHGSIMMHKPFGQRVQLVNIQVDVRL